MSHAPGFGEIELTSQAGAPTMAIVPLPALSPLGLVVLTTVLGGMVLLLLVRRPARQSGPA